MTGHAQPPKSSPPRLVAICQNPHGDGLWFESEPGRERCPEVGCDCSPALYVLAEPTDEMVEQIAQAMADHENEHRYELTSGSQSTGVEPYEAGPDDFRDIAAAVATALSTSREPEEGHHGAVEVCFDDGGRVRLAEIPVNLDRPPWGCSGCSKPIAGGDAFFVEVDDMARSGWGVGLMAVCAPCLTLALKPRNLSALSRKEKP